MTRHGFSRTVAIDWSGAKGSRHKGIAIAEAREGTPPRLICPDHTWSRTDVRDWLLQQAAAEPTLFGFDFSFAPPIIERGAYLPGEKGVPAIAREFWAYVDHLAPDLDLGAASFLERVHRRHFYFGIADGVKADFMHFRQCERRVNDLGGRKTATVYDAIGAAQVAKASFAGMRLLHQLAGRIPIWPMDSVRDGQSAIVEIYTRIYIRRAGLSGAKIRDRAELNRALAALGAPAWRGRHAVSDHQTDALVTAAGMWAHLTDVDAFRPPGLTPQIAQSEGWTFGVS
nr:hypothetical protein [uncultured Sphingomonas sp.]